MATKNKKKKNKPLLSHSLFIWGYFKSGNSTTQLPPSIITEEGDFPKPCGIVTRHRNGQP